MKNLFKKKVNKVSTFIAISALFVSFTFLSLACASTPEPAPEPTSTITLADVNSLIQNQEINLLSNNGLTAEQLMEVIKLCIQTEEITNVSLVEEKAQLSYGVLIANMGLSKIPVPVKFSCSISKTGTLKMRVISVTEQHPEGTPFQITVYTKDYEARCDAIKNSVLNKLESIGNTVLARSADFA